MAFRNDGHHAHAAKLELLSHLDRHHIAATRRHDESGVQGGDLVVAQDSLCETGHILEEHRLALPVRANHKIVETQTQFHDRIESGNEP
jgi:hypothetical protein